MQAGAYESICVGGGHIFLPALGNIVPPLKNLFYVNYSILYPLPYNKC